MKRHALFHRALFGATVLAATLLALQWGVTPQAVADEVPDFQLDETCTASLQGRPDVRVNSDGTFRIRNIPGGNTILDRVTGICVRDGETIYWRSPCFAIEPNCFYIVPNDVTACTEPFAELKDLDCTSPLQTLTGVGQQVQLQVLATLTNDAVVDLTNATDCTQYRSTNPAIATVDENGLVTAGGTNGTVFVVTTNTGKIDFCRLNVAAGDPLTKVVGNVKLPADQGGGPAVGATVIARGVEGTTDANGDFCLEDVPTLDENDQLQDIVVNASLGELTGNSDPTPPVQNGITDVGMFALDFTKACPTVRVGEPFLPGTGNCFPFGCVSNRRWQQVMVASQFPGPMLIKNFSVFNRGFAVGPVKTADYTVVMSTVQIGNPIQVLANDLSPNMANNLGPDAMVVLQGRFPDATHGAGLGPTRTFPLDTPFCYDPAEGNLLIQVFTDNATGFSVFFDRQPTAGAAGLLAARTYSGSPNPNLNASRDNDSLVMEFNTPESSDEADESPQPQPAPSVETDAQGLPIGG